MSSGRSLEVGGGAGHSSHFRPRASGGSSRDARPGSLMEFLSSVRLRRFRLQRVAMLVVLVYIWSVVYARFFSAAGGRHHRGAAHGAAPGDADDAEHPHDRMQAHHGVLPAMDSHDVRFVTLAAYSSQDAVRVLVDGKVVLSVDKAADKDHEKYRGMNVVVVNPRNGVVTAIRVFDTYLTGADHELLLFLRSVPPGRLIAIAIKDEGTFGLKEEARLALAALGAQDIRQLSWRDTWAFIAQQPTAEELKKNADGVAGQRPPAVAGDGIPIGRGESRGPSPDLSTWGPPSSTSARFSRDFSPRPSCFDASDRLGASAEAMRARTEFCDENDGYPGLCAARCNDYEPLFTPSPRRTVPYQELAGIPVVIMASNRPNYLFRMLRYLLEADGADRSMIMVAVDGYHAAPAKLAQLYGLNVYQHAPKGDRNGRICYHYKKTLTHVFDVAFPEAQAMILLEEDLQVAPDFFHFFAQLTQRLLSEPSLFCASAWNDIGYKHSSRDPSLLYLVDTMPGLGWMLKRSLYKGELEAVWPKPELHFDWDMWMRMEINRKNRPCIIPDVSRTFHFGASGLNMNPYFQSRYFDNKALNSDPAAVLKNVRKAIPILYGKDLDDLITLAEVLDHSKNPCSLAGDFFPAPREDEATRAPGSYDTYVFALKMSDEGDRLKHWGRLATCMRVWDLDARGFYDYVWRFFANGHHIICVGTMSPWFNSLKRRLGEFGPIRITKEDLAAWKDAQT